MNRRQNQLLVHSFLYYQMNENIISDPTFDRWSKELADLIKDYPEEFKESHNYEGFKTFDGSTGYDLPFHTPFIQDRAVKLLEYHRRNK